MTTNDLQDISTLFEMGAKLEAVELVHPTTVSFQVLLTFSIKANEQMEEDETHETLNV